MRLPSSAPARPVARALSRAGLQRRGNLSDASVVPACPGRGWRQPQPYPALGLCAAGRPGAGGRRATARPEDAGTGLRRRTCVAVRQHQRNGLAQGSWLSGPRRHGATGIPPTADHAAQPLSRPGRAQPGQRRAAPTTRQHQFPGFAAADPADLADGHIRAGQSGDQTPVLLLGDSGRRSERRRQPDAASRALARQPAVLPRPARRTDPGMAVLAGSRRNQRPARPRPAECGTARFGKEFPAPDIQPLHRQRQGRSPARPARNARPRRTRRQRCRYRDAALQPGGG